MSFVPPGYLTPSQLVDLVSKDEQLEALPLSRNVRVQALFARAEERRQQERRAKAFGTLQAPLYTGDIQAIILEDGREHQVPRSVWGQDNAALTFSSGFAHIPGPRKGRVFFDRAKVEAWLAARDGDGQPQQAPTSAAETRAHKWFRGEVAKGNQRKTRDDYCAEMARQFGVSERGARRIWEQLAPQDWRKQGRRGFLNRNA
jgi:hypothetical protein